MTFLAATVHAPVADKLTSAIATLMTDFKNYRLYRKTISELQGLTNEELVDLGLNRSTINVSAREAVYGY